MGLACRGPVFTSPSVHSRERSGQGRLVGRKIELGSFRVVRRLNIDSGQSEVPSQTSLPPRDPGRTLYHRVVGGLYE